MKNFCFVVQDVYDSDPRVRRKAEALVAAGWSVDVLALRAPDGKKDYRLNDVRVRTLSLGKNRGSLLRYAFEYAVFFFWAMFRLAFQMLSRHYSVVDVNTLPDFLIFTSVLAKWMGAKTVLDMHEITPEFYMSKYGVKESSFGIRLMKFIERISFSFPDHVITINEPIQDLLVSRGLRRSKSTIIMNAVDESRFIETSSRSCDAVSNSLGKFVMMYHGTLTPIYGLDIAIEAFSKVHERMPGARLCILGSGTEKNKLQELAERRGLGLKVTLVGKVASPEIPGWLKRCDVGVLPIRRDVFLDFAFPNKLPEFIVAGKPVIVARLKAIRKYFSEDAVAYFEPNDAVDLSRQMLRLYEEQELTAKLTEVARREYAPIRWAVMKERYLRLVQQLTDGVEDGIEEDSFSVAKYPIKPVNTNSLRSNS